GYIALQRDFSQLTADPVHVVVDDASSREVSARAEGLRDRLARDERFGPGEIRRAGDVIDLVVPVKGDAAGDSAVAAVRELRRWAPETVAGTDADPLAGGSAPENTDSFANVTTPAPLVFAFVLGLTLVLLTVAFRSIAIALTAIALNLLSVGAAYGLLVLVFQHGVGADLLGFQQIDTIE